MSKLPNSYEQRMCQHMHNALVGRIISARGAIEAVIDSRSTTPETKEWAAKVLASFTKLLELMRDRVNSDGSTSHMKVWIRGKGYNSISEVLGEDGD